MFENKELYMTQGVVHTLSLELRHRLLQMILSMPKEIEKDYFQVFCLSERNGKQVIKHFQEQPSFEEEIVVDAVKPLTTKVYCVDDGDYATMLLAEEY